MESIPQNSDLEHTSSNKTKNSLGLQFYAGHHGILSVAELRPWFLESTKYKSYSTGKNAITQMRISVEYATDTS